uniref:Mitogen-activated protein kinase kinase kinase 14b n=1 Tax=Nothobranchius furzeri TaxID=105023 RepID=A0A8C6Q4K1_NOTFU
MNQQQRLSEVSSYRGMSAPQMFDTSSSVIVMTHGSELSPGTSSARREEKTNPVVQAVSPHLTKVMQLGTATPVTTQQDHSLSIVAQAEREDLQEFSLSNTQRLASRSQLYQRLRPLSEDAFLVSDEEEEEEEEAAWNELLHQQLRRKQRRKTRSRQRRLKDGGEPPVIQGLWVQEIDWLKMTSSTEIIPPPPQFTDSCCHGNHLQTGHAFDDSRSSDCGSIITHEDKSDSSCRADTALPGAQTNMSGLTFDLMHISGFDTSHQSEWDSDSSLQGVSDSSLSSVNSSQRTCSSGSEPDSEALRGRVIQIPKLLVTALFRESVEQILDGWKTNKPANEGFIFHHLLQPSTSYQYREGVEYSVLHHIQNGSYGDVFCVQDKHTGFTCAAKRIPLRHFSVEEVRTWSTLNSPRVVELFGAVRDGLNVVLFMDQKPACLGQVLKEVSCLPEDLALHYLHQTLGALEHLHHRKVLHLDVKAENVLLSADGRDTFLCDFGLSEMLDGNRGSSKAFRGAAFPGTETHMAPEVARGDPACTKADVWSSCCMLLHMLNGCQPWTRHFSHPLCLHIVHEPPPLWEVPSTCNNFTAKVFKAGLQKNPDRRASAQKLRRRTSKALRAVGGLSPSSIKSTCQSPWRTQAVDQDSDEWDGDTSDLESEIGPLTKEWDSCPRSLWDQVDWESGSESDVDIYMGEEENVQETCRKTDKNYEGDWEEEEEDEDCDSSASTEYLHALRGVFPLLQKGLQMDDVSWGSGAELEGLREDVPVGTMFPTPSPEPRDEPPSCLSCSDSSQINKSETDSDHSSDDLSSGVFSSCNSQADTRVEWLMSANQTSSCCFEGVDIWIENTQGDCLRIREHRRVKVGHVAIGISDQMSGKAFSLETLDRKTVSFDEQIEESGSWFRCVPAPDRCQRWRWRIRDGRLELRE